MASEYLKFNGERYQLYGMGGILKSSAKRKAAELREKGYKARIVKRDNGWAVYYRKS